jgi:hypothetical protein
LLSISQSLDRTEIVAGIKQLVPEYIGDGDK